MTIAFYPCCAADIFDPCRILNGMAAEIVFCDVDDRLRVKWQELAATAPLGSPKATFVIGDALGVVKEMPRIDILFYRRDSDGEGGSGVYVLGDQFLRKLALKFPSQGARIITDGSNSRGSNFGRMIRKRGLAKHGWRFFPEAEQPFLTGYGLQVIGVEKQT